MRPRLAREYDKLPPLTEPGTDYVYSDFENGMIGLFKARARTALAQVSADTDLLAWLSLMQHYGAPTRLLDWSASPFVGLFFACTGAYSDGGMGALWGLNAYFCARQARGPSFPHSWDHLGTLSLTTVDAEGKSVTTWPSLERSRRDRENELIRWAIGPGDSMAPPSSAVRS